MTTLRYTPDKPYKLQIFAVNSEVEIFGITDTLYYIRHGKTYGFLPKNHLREKARGDYPFTVEIDIDKYRIDQTIREQNFLHEFLKPSQPVGEVPLEPRVNETISEQTQNGTQPEAVKEKTDDSRNDNEISNSSANKIPPVVPLDPTKDSTEKIETPAVAEAVLGSEENGNDSGIDEDDEDDDDEEDEDSDEEVPELKEEILKPQQPELVAIPPGKDSERVASRDEVPLALPIAASFVEETNFKSEAENATASPQVVQVVPDFVPIKSDAAVEAENILQLSNNDTIQAEPLKVLPEDIKTEEVVSTTTPPIGNPPEVQMVETASTTVQDHPIAEDLPASAGKLPTVQEQPGIIDQAAVQEPSVIAKEQQPVVTQDLPNVQNINAKPVDPAPVTEQVYEKWMDNNQPPINNDKLVQAETVAVPKVETVTETVVPEQKHNVEATTPAPLQIEIPIVTTPAPVQIEMAIPSKVETATETVITEEKHNVEATTPAPLQIEIPIASVPAPTQVDIPIVQTTEKPELTIEETTPTPQKEPLNQEPDALLKRFNEKLGNRIVEGTGKGSVEPLHKPEVHHSHEHHHQHGHDHHHNQKDHQHNEHAQDHQHDEKQQEAQSEKSPELPQTEETVEPGFFGGLLNKFKFFSDKDDSEQHFHENAPSDSGPSTVPNGKFF